jgi:hypothetical protein
MSEAIKAVKAGPFDGTEESFFLWAHQILSYVEAHSPESSLLGNLADAFDPTVDTDISPMGMFPCVYSHLRMRCC